MSFTTRRTASSLRPGYVSTLTVLVLSAILMIMVSSAFRFSLQSQEVQKKSQLRIDYSQREQALLRGVISQVANSAMRCMMTGSNSLAWQNPVRWRYVFENARNQAQGETALEDNVAVALGIIGSAISGNTGDGTQELITYNISSTVSQSSEHLFYINGGTNSTGTTLGTGYPESLSLSSSSVARLDRDRPIISLQKKYADGSLYKALPYPNVHFGYSTQGQTFVAKRNWWAFSMTYGGYAAAATGVQTKKRKYVLSLYEVPSQLGLSSTALTNLGKHADGTAWENVSIQGAVFASSSVAEGGVSLERLASRRGISLGDSSTVGGVGHDTIQGGIPSREDYEASNADFFPMSNSGDSGLVGFVTINRGEDAFDNLSDTSDANSASPTGWNYYSRPAMQCVMNLRVEDVYSPTEQVPTQISFAYKVGGIDRRDTFTAGTNWPGEGTPEGALFPFHLEETPYGRLGIAVHVQRLAEYLKAAGADPLGVNSSLLVNANYRDNSDIMRPNIPSLSGDICLILRDARDLTPFTSGLSIVTPFRLYLASDVNLVSSGTGPDGQPDYPPLSIFAPEKRFGLRKEAITIRFDGQINHVGQDANAAARPLDLPSGQNEDVMSDTIFANLYSITDPSQLPPINHMNWLIVIEEVQ